MPASRPANLVLSARLKGTLYNTRPELGGVQISRFVPAGARGIAESDVDMSTLRFQRSGQADGRRELHS